jgi:hypothetical protein
MSTPNYIRSISDILPDDFGSSPTPLMSQPTTDSSFSWQTWVIIILILALLGINIFVYLAKGTEELTNILRPLLTFFGYNTLTTTKQVVETSATGAKAGVDVVAGTTTGAIDATLAETERQNWRQDSVSRALNDAGQQSTNTVQPHDNAVSGKSGWCLIGEDQGIRTCSEIGANDVCMSGDIFPTHSVCVNPKLRY